MNADELRKSIKIEKRDIGNGVVELTARVSFSASFRVDKAVQIASPAAFNETIDHELKERLIQGIYADHRRDMYEALHAFMCCQPFDYLALNEARNKIITAARFSGYDFSGTADTLTFIQSVRDISAGLIAKNPMVSVESAISNAFQQAERMLTGRWISTEKKGS